MISQLGKIKTPINIAIIGIGAMGKGLTYQCKITPGVRCTAIADVDLEKAVAVAKWLHPENYAVVESQVELAQAVESGKMAVCADGDLLAKCDYADVLIEGSNSIIPAVEFSITALEHGKHLVLMNSEIDLFFGPYLMELAHSNGVVFTSCDGDQHTVLKRIVNDITLWGFDLVMAGNIKGYLDRYSNPTAIIPEADKRNLGYQMATAYTDGTKLCIEMALAANSMNLKTIQPGMLGPRSEDVSQVLGLFNFEEIYADGSPVVDYVLGGTPGGGVFVVGYSDDPYQMSMMQYYKMGDGPFYIFYRPYHLCHVESIECAADAYLNQQSLMEPTYGLKTNVYSYSKKDMKAGETLDGIGGYTCYGLIENNSDASLDDGLPIFLAEDVKLIRDVKKDQRLTMADIQQIPTRFDFELYEKTKAASRRITQ